MERYERILTIAEKHCQENCPLVFEKGALLKDNKFKQNVLQLQFRNISLKKIKAVYILIFCLDIEKTQVETVEKIYLDLEVSYNNTFGDTSAIMLKNDLSRHFEFAIQKIIFSDDTVSEYSGKMKNFAKIQDLNAFGKLKDQFVREVQKINPSIACKVKPSEDNGMWYCTCGALNFGENTKCGICALKKDELFSLLDDNFLEEKNTEYLKQKEADEIARKLQEEQRIEELRLQDEARKEKRNNIKKKIKKVLMILIIIVVVSGILYGVTTSFVIPAVKYSSALKSIENRAYEEGYEILESLGDYSDAADQILISKYAVAKEYLESGNYKEAIEGFTEISEYSDSTVVLKEARYLYAKELMGTKNYIMALNQLAKIKDYEDAGALYIECSYSYAEQLFELEDYKYAAMYYEIAGEYQDAKDKLLESKYQFCKAIADIKDSTVSKYIDQLIDANYKDAKELYDELTKTEISIVVNNSQSDSITDAASLSRNNVWYFHITLIGSIPNERIVFQYALEFPNGDMSWGDAESLGFGEEIVISGWYDNAKYSDTGTAVLWIYDENGNVLVTKSVEIY